MVAVTEGDVKIDGKPYLLTAGGYDVNESTKTRPAPAAQPRTLSTLEHQNNYSYFGQTKFLSQGFPIWQGEGPFDIGYGMSMDTDGTASVADQLVKEVTDTFNVDGYVGFRIGYGAGPTGGSDGGGDRVVFVGKTNGYSYVKKTTGGWSNNIGISSATPARKAVSHGFFSSISLVGDDYGDIWRTALGTPYTDFVNIGHPDASVVGFNAYILGSFKGQLYIGYGKPTALLNSIWRMNSDLTWDMSDPAGFLHAGALDMTPVTGASGTNVLYITTAGPSPRILFTDGKELFQANEIPSDFSPHASAFFGRLFIFGEQGFDTFSKGACWALGSNGLIEELSFGDASLNQGIFTAQVEGEVILWAATGNAAVPSGIGVWDPRLDQSPDAALGFYLSNVIPAAVGANKVIGLAALLAKRYAGVAGVGIYGTTTPGPFYVRTGLFGADQRNMQKRWPVAEVHHSPLAAGQSFEVKTITEKGATEVSWGSSTTTGARSKQLFSPNTGAYAPPADYRTPYLQAIVVGVANGLPLTLYDVALGYILATDNANMLREWTLRVAVEGFDDTRISDDPGKARQYNRLGAQNARTSMQMLTDLNGILNKEVQFEDIDGTVYTALVKAGGYHPTTGWPSRYFPEIDRRVVNGVVVDISVAYRLTLIQTR